ncbi:MAG: IS110 family transposase [Chloroflexi bacterium OHK40]
MWYAGIDWADDHHDAVVLDHEGQLLTTLRVAHSVTGLAELTTALTRITGPDAKDQLSCIVETNHGLLITALLEAGFAVYPVNPKTVNRRRGAAGAKTDQIDAYLLAKLGRSDLADLRRLVPDSPVVQELKALTRDQDGLIQSQTRLLNQLTACLKAYYPVALLLFSKLHQPSALAFLRAYPKPEAARTATQADILQTLLAAGHTRTAQVVPKIWQRLQQPALSADAVTTRTKARLMLALVAQLEPLLAQIAAYDEEITRLFVSHADHALFASLPRAGRRLAPRLLAEIGDDRGRYDDAVGLQAVAGTAPVMFQSGAYAKAHRRWACMKPLRNALQLFAWQSTLEEAWALHYYQQKRATGKSHAMAVRALANVWVRIIYAMWRDRKPYQAQTFIGAQQQHQRQAA